MGTHVRQDRISPKDLLLREAALLEYLATWCAQSESLVAVMMVNYPCSFAKLSNWGSVLASLRHRIEEQSALLSSMALSVSRTTHGTPTSYSAATATCSRLFEVRNDTPSSLPMVQGQDLARNVLLLQRPPGAHSL